MNSKNTFRAAQILALAAIGMLLLINVIPKKLDVKTHCQLSPNDEGKCDCVQKALKHVKFTHTFNDTTPNLLELLFNGTNPYGGNMTIEAYGNNESGILLIKNLPPKYYLYYGYEVIGESCVLAKPRLSAKQIAAQERCRERCVEKAKGCRNSLENVEKECGGIANETECYRLAVLAASTVCQERFEKCGGKC